MNTGKLPLVQRNHRRVGSVDTHPHTTRNNYHKAKEFPLRFLRPTLESRDGSMDAYSGSVGEKAKLDFYDTFINLPLFSQRNKHQNLEDSPNLAYLGAVEKERLKPNPFGIVRRKGTETSIDIHQYSMGDSYAKAFSEGLKHIKDVTTVNLKANRLTDNGAAQILSNLVTKNIKKIILSENRISNQSVQVITSLIANPQNQLKVLDIENTYISERSLISLLDYLKEDTKLSRLSLARNNIGLGSIISLTELLKTNKSVKYLDLHWNSLGMGGSVEFLEALAQNEKLLHIDLSYNSFGRKDGMATANAFAKMFSQNKSLKHIDLSNNYFSRKECDVVGEGLKDNHTIYGIHMQGNDCLVDAKGYIIPLEYLNKTEQGHLHRRLLNSQRFQSRNASRINCWICEKWVEVKILWKPGFSGEAKDPPIFIHLECDNFKQCAMQTGKDSEFYVSRIVPPGMLKFFFSDVNTMMISKEYNTNLLENPLKIEYPTADGSKNYVSVSKINAIFIESEDWNMSEVPTIKPRNDPRIKERVEMIIEKIPWTVETSVFKDYQFDTEELMLACCDYDMEVSNIKEVLPNPQEQKEIREVVKNHYKHITEAFRQLSAISGIELFSIGKNVLNEFLKKCSFNEEVMPKDVGILWNQSNAPQSKGEKFNAGNGLCRYEFAEFLIRLAIELFYKTKKCETINDSWNMLMDNYVLPGIKKYDQSSWHGEKYLKEDVDLFFRFHRPIFEGVFYKYAAMGKGPLDKMNLHEFRLMCNETGFCNDSFVMREIDMCFRQAMMTEVDEILHGEHLQMVYVEFIEAIARIADQIFPNKTGEPYSLKSKLEKIIPYLLRVCPPKSVNGFEYPTESSYHNMKYRKKIVTIQEYIEAS